MKPNLGIALLVGLVAVMAGVAFVTFLESPQGKNEPVEADAALDPESVMQQVAVTVDSLKGALEKNPKDLAALIALGNLYYDASMYPPAIEYYTQAVEINPRNAAVWTDLGTMHRHNGELDRAVECYQKATEVDPQNKNAWFNLGIIYRFDKNQPGKALQAWKKFLTLVPPDDPHYQSLKQEVAQMELENK